MVLQQRKKKTTTIVNMNAPYSGIVNEEFNSIVMVQKVKMEKLFLIYGTLEMVQQVQKSALPMYMEKKEHILWN